MTPRGNWLLAVVATACLVVAGVTAIELRTGPDREADRQKAVRSELTQRLDTLAVTMLTLRAEIRDP